MRYEVRLYKVPKLHPFKSWVGKTFYRIWDVDLKQWGFAMYTTPESAADACDSRNGVAMAF
jgi:hypothetical protein